MPHPPCKGCVKNMNRIKVAINSEGHVGSGDLEAAESAFAYHEQAPFIT